MEEVEQLCNNIFILDEGKEVASGSISAIKSMASIHGTIKLTLEDSSEEVILKIKELSGVKDCLILEDKINIFFDDLNFDLQELLTLIAKENKKIKSFNIEEASLEEVFLSLTGKKLRD